MHRVFEPADEPRIIKRSPISRGGAVRPLIKRPRDPFKFLFHRFFLPFFLSTVLYPAP